MTLLSSITLAILPMKVWQSLLECAYVKFTGSFPTSTQLQLDPPTGNTVLLAQIF